MASTSEYEQHQFFKMSKQEIRIKELVNLLKINARRTDNTKKTINIVIELMNLYYEK